MSDFTELPRAIKDCMERAGEPLSEDQYMLLAGYLAPYQEKAEQNIVRMAELLTICQAIQRDLLLRAEPDFDGSGTKVVNLSAGFWDELNRVIGKYDNSACRSFHALILRKQAEAVEETQRRIAMAENIKGMREAAREYSEELRQQADKAETEQESKPKSTQKFCTYPDCLCPFDMGAEFFCLRGLDQAPKNTR